MMSKNNITFDLTGDWDLKLCNQQNEETTEVDENTSSHIGELVLKEKVHLPGTLDENKVGNLFSKQDQERLSRYYTFTGAVSYEKDVFVPDEWKEKQILLYMERSRETTVYVNDIEVTAPETSNILAVPQIYNITKQINFGADNRIKIIVDNSYPNLPKESILRSSMATDETQTNWNGIVGKVGLQVVEAIRIEKVCIYPNPDLKSVTVSCDITNDSTNTFTGFIQMSITDLTERNEIIQIKASDKKTIKIYDFILGEDIKLWSEFTPHLYTMKVSLRKICDFDGIKNVKYPKRRIGDMSELERKTWDVSEPERRTEEVSESVSRKVDISESEIRDVSDTERRILDGSNTKKDNNNVIEGILQEELVTFGMRTFTANKELGRLLCNNEAVFLRCEANCAVFPLTGYAPMDEISWEKLFTTYQSYGINTVRFHSWCPPKAAFVVADRMGMYLQPELSCWEHITMFGDEIQKNYYRKEALAILKEYANHPSFVMLTLGNELQFTDLEYGETLLRELKETDSTRLYSYASNGYYGNVPPLKNSDFYTAQVYLDSPIRGMFSGMRGFINEDHPGTQVNYEEGVQRVIDGGHPVFSFEVGQFQVFPDVLKETSEYSGVLEPRNFHVLIEQLKEKQIDSDTVENYIKASGMLSRIGYRNEIEAARRTNNLSGISLLGIQDFSGQGTALVGMMNSLGNTKPYEFAEPKDFMNFFGEQVLLFETEKFCYNNKEKIVGRILVSNYGRSNINGVVTYELIDHNKKVHHHGEINSKQYQMSNLNLAGDIQIPLDNVSTPKHLRLILQLNDLITSYDIWVYPQEVHDDTGEVYIVKTLDEQARNILKAGGKVLLSPSPTKEAMPNSLVGTFTTSFWSSIFASETQPGTMGLLINSDHPVFSGFPTEYHTNHQWWPMTRLGRTMILDKLVDKNGNKIKPIIQVVDGFLTLRNLGLLYEVSIGEGKLMVSSMGLEEWKEDYIEVSALRNSLIEYMNSELFQPVQEVSLELLMNEFHV